MKTRILIWMLLPAMWPAGLWQRGHDPNIQGGPSRFGNAPRFSRPIDIPAQRSDLRSINGFVCGNAGFTIV